MKHLAFRAVALALIAALAFGGGSALADPAGADIPLLIQLLANSVEQLDRMNATLATLRKSYEEARRVAAIAVDAKETVEYFAQYNNDLFARDVSEGLDRAFPELERLRRIPSDTESWTRGSGELQRLTVLCLGNKATGPACVQLHDALSVKEARDALRGTFGSIPVGATKAEVQELKAIDHETAVAIAGASSQAGRNALTRAQADALLRACADVLLKPKDRQAACAAAAHAAEIRSLRQSAELTDQVAEGNRLAALQLQQANAARKRELMEAEQRRRLLLGGAAQIPPLPSIRSDGLPIFEGER